MHAALDSLDSAPMAIVGPIRLPNHAPNRFSVEDASAYVDTFLPHGWERWGLAESKRAETGHAVIEFWAIRCDFVDRMLETRQCRSNGPKHR